MIIKDSQKSIVYRKQFEVSRPVGDEKFPVQTLRSVAEGLWNRLVPGVFKSPEIKIDKEDGNVYLPDHHTILLSERSVTVLLHELGHASVTAMGRVLFTESHGPLFCHEFGRFWTEYSAMDFELWQSRWEDEGVDVANCAPILDGERWAVPKRRGVAVRPASDVIQSQKLEVERIFTDIDLHPLT